MWIEVIDDGFPFCWEPTDPAVSLEPLVQSIWKIIDHTLCCGSLLMWHFFDCCLMWHVFIILFLTHFEIHLVVKVDLNKQQKVFAVMWSWCGVVLCREKHLGFIVKDLSHATVCSQPFHQESIQLIRIKNSWQLCFLCMKWQTTALNEWLRTK